MTKIEVRCATCWKRHKVEDPTTPFFCNDTCATIYAQAHSGEGKEDARRAWAEAFVGTTVFDSFHGQEIGKVVSWRENGTRRGVFLCMDTGRTVLRAYPTELR